MSGNQKRPPKGGLADQLAEAVGNVATTVKKVAPKVVTPKQAAPTRDEGIPEFFGFTGPNNVFSFTKAGEPISRTLPWAQEPATAPVGVRFPSYAFGLPLTVSGNRESFVPTGPGLILVSGATEAGKSSFLRGLSALTDGMIERLQAVEPYDDPDEIGVVRSFSSADSALVHAVGRHFVKGETSTLFAIDSLRAPLFETSGPAGSKGVIMPFFTQLTRCSNQLADSGMTVLATVNPMDEDAQFTEAFLKKLSASTSMYINLVGIERTPAGATYSGYVQVRPRRVKRPFTMFVPAKVSSVAPKSDLLSEITFSVTREFSSSQYLNSAYANNLSGSI